MLAFTVLNLVGCSIQSGDSTEWNQAKRSNTFVSYDNYLKSHPAGRFASEAQIAQRSFARFAIKVSDPLKSRQNYGHDWGYTITFNETNGVGATIDSSEMRIYEGNNRYWTSAGGNRWTIGIFDSNKQENVVLKIPPNGTASYTNCVFSSNQEFVGKRMSIEYFGRDNNGHAITLGTSFLLVK